MRLGQARYAVVVLWAALSLAPLVNACGASAPAKTFDAGRGGSSGGSGGNGGSGGYGGCLIMICPGCGNGALEAGEACDDGNTVFGDGCNGLCQIESHWDCSAYGCYRLGTCGNGGVEPDEACDDGNQQDGDGCAANCARVERGWYCPQHGQPCKLLGVAGSPDGGASAAMCGNGVVEPGEACDDGLDPAAGPTNDGEYGGCGITCQLAPHCGDGIVNGPEECDRGEWNGTDDGPASCTAGCLHRYCGDGFADGDLGEECDLGELNGQPGEGCDQACKNVSTPEPCIRCI